MTDPDKHSRGDQTDFDFLKEACREDTRSEMAHLIATAHRYGIGDPELMSDFVALLKGPQQSTSEANPLGKRTPEGGEPRGSEASIRPGTLRRGFGVEIGQDGFPGRANHTGTGDIE